MRQKSDGRKSYRKRTVFFIILVAVFMLGGILIVSADSGIWVGALSNRWNENGNWIPETGYPNAAGETATFDDGGLRHDVKISNTTVKIGSIVFLSNAGYSLDASSGGIIFDNLIKSANLFSAAGANTVTGPIEMKTDLKVTNNSTSRLVVSGPISGSDELVISGSGETVFTGNNIHTDPTYVNNSTLILGSDTAAGLSSLILFCQKPCTEVFPTVTLGNLGQKTVINNPLKVKVNQVRFIGPGDMAFTSSGTTLFQDTVFDVEATTSFASLGYKGVCGYNLLKRGDGILNLNLTTCSSANGILANQIGAGQLNLYGGGAVGPVVFNTQTGGGGIWIGDRLDVVNNELHRAIDTLTVKGLLAIRSDATRLAFDLNGTTPGSTYDQVVVQGDIVLNNPSLDIDLGFVPALGTRFTLMSVDKLGLVQGNFRDLPDGSLLIINGLEFVINYTPSEVTLTRIDVLTLEKVVGDAQSTVVTTLFPEALQVKATNSDGTPIAGLRINYLSPFFGPSTEPKGAAAVTDINGVASIFVRANVVAGSFQVNASVPLLNLEPVIFNLTNLPDVVTGLRVSGFQNPAITGTPYPFEVRSVDDYGNFNPAFLGTIRFVSDDPQASLPPDYTFTVNDAGSHTFTGILNQVGTHFIMAVDVSNSTLFGLQANIIVISGTTAMLSVSGYPSVVNVGESHTFTVQALDGARNVTQNYTGTVTFSSDDSLAELPTNFTFPGNSGTVEFNAIFRTPGVHYLRVTDINNGTITGEQTGIQVLPSQPAALLVDSGSGQTTGIGMPFRNPLVVRVVDGSGNPVSGDPVTFISPSSGASCTFSEGNDTVTTDAQGKAALTPVANLIVGNYTVVAQSGSLSALFELANVKNLLFIPTILYYPDSIPLD